MQTKKIAQSMQGVPDEIQNIIGPIVQRIGVINGDFEEQLLDQELWASVDLLQNMGIKHHQLFEDIIARIEQGQPSEELKSCVRQGRVAIGDWLFSRFKDISQLDSPNSGALRAFELYLSQLDALCALNSTSSISLRQHDALFKRLSSDSGYTAGVKWLKRNLHSRFGIHFTRQLNPQLITRHAMMIQLPRHLLAIANRVGEAEFFLLRRVKALYEELDTTYNLFLSKLDGVEEKGELVSLSTAAEQVRDEVDESFKLVGMEVMNYYEDIRSAMNAEVEACLLRWIHILDQAGTVGVQQIKNLTEDRIQNQKDQLLGRLAYWGGYLVGFAGVHSMELEMARLQNDLRHVIDETVLQINARLREKLVAECSGVQQRNREAWTQLRELANAKIPIDQVREQVESARQSIVEFLDGTIQKRVRSIGASAEVVQLIDLLSERFRRLVDSTAEYYQIVELEDMPMQEGFVPRQVPLKKAPLRAVVASFIEQDLIRRLGDVNREMIEQVNVVLAAIEQYTTSVNYSMGTIAVELREGGRNAEELIGVALGRMQHAEDNLLHEVAHIERANSEVREKTIASVADVARRLRQMVLDESVSQMQREAKKSSRSKSVPHENAIKKTQLTEEKGDATNWAVEEELGRAETLGFEAISGLEQQLDERVPFTYRRLFRTSPLEVSAFLKGRSGALGTIETAVGRWNKGLFSALVMVGEQGSGKTSLINCALEQKLSDMPVVRHRMRTTLVEVDGLASLLGQLLGLQSESMSRLKEDVLLSKMRRIIILEDVHRMYVRSKGGLQVMREFLDFVDATGSHILWFISIDQFAWTYLNVALSLSRHFTFLIETGRLSGNELERAIMARHQATGYDLRFTAATNERGDDQDSRRHAYFAGLSAASSGNVFSAIYYWLQSIERVEENVVEIGSIKEMNLSFLQSLSLEALLDLSIFVQHGALTADLFRQIFHLPLIESRARLTHLHRLGLLGKEEGIAGEEYAVNPLLYHPIVVELKRRNIVQ